MILPGRFHPVPTQPVFGPLSVGPNPEVRIVPAPRMKPLPPVEHPPQSDEMLPLLPQMEQHQMVEPEEARREKPSQPIAKGRDPNRVVKPAAALNWARF